MASSTRHDICSLGSLRFDVRYVLGWRRLGVHRLQGERCAEWHRAQHLRVCVWLLCQPQLGLVRWCVRLLVPCVRACLIGACRGSDHVQCRDGANERSSCGLFKRSELGQCGDICVQLWLLQEPRLQSGERPGHHRHRNVEQWHSNVFW